MGIHNIKSKRGRIFIPFALPSPLLADVMSFTLPVPYSFSSSITFPFLFPSPSLPP